MSVTINHYKLIGSPYTGFRLIPTLMTLNDLEWRNSPYFAFFFTEFDCFAGQLHHSG